MPPRVFLTTEFAEILREVLKLISLGGLPWHRQGRCGQRELFDFYPIPLARTLLNGFTQLHFIMTISKGREVRCFTEIASKNGVIDFGVKLLERIGKTFVVTTWIGCDSP